MDIQDLTGQEITYFFGMVKAFRLMGVSVAVAKDRALADIRLHRACEKYDSMSDYGSGDPGEIVELNPKTHYLS